MMFADVLRALLPPEAYDPQGTRLSAVLEAEGGALGAARDSAGDVHDAMVPASAGAAIADWERMLAIDPVPSATQGDRVQAVVAALANRGGLSRQYFAQLASGMGYTISIIEPRAFRCGVGRCGDRLYGADIAFVWQVIIQARPAGATAAMDAALQTLFQRLKPAHTQCQFVES